VKQFHHHINHHINHKPWREERAPHNLGKINHTFRINVALSASSRFSPLHNLYRNNPTPPTFISGHQVMIIITPQENPRNLYIIPVRRFQEIQRGALNHITIRILIHLRRSLILNQVQTRTINHQVIAPHSMLNNHTDCLFLAHLFRALGLTRKL
jgi:hypothetical protein